MVAVADKQERNALRELAAHAAPRTAIDALQAQNYIMRGKYDAAIANVDAAGDDLEELGGALAQLVGGRTVPRDRSSRAKKDDRSAPKYRGRTARSRSRVVKTPKPKRRR